MRWLLLVLLMLLVSLQYQLWFRGGMDDLWELEKALAIQIEERARSELGMVKQGEKLIQLAEPDRAAEAAARRDAEEPR